MKFGDLKGFNEFNEKLKKLNKNSKKDTLADLTHDDYVFENGGFVKSEESNSLEPVEPIEKEEKEEPKMETVKDSSNKKDKDKYKLSKDFLKIVGLIVSGILLVLSLLTMANSFVPAQKIDTLILSYNVNNTADYKVNLIPNDFYETTTLGKGELVPVTFIDNIEIDFSGFLSANKALNFNYRYRVTGEITATANDNGKQNSGGKIWTKNYTFVPSKSLTTNNTGYNVHEKVVIDYNIYNDLVNQYKLKAAVPMEAVLTVTLAIDASSNADGQALNESNAVSVKIPLSVATVMISDTSTDTATKTLINTEEIAANTNYVLLGISIAILIGSLVATILLLKSLRKMTEDHSLLLKFNRIMRDYNQVIIEIEELPEVKDAAVIEVKSFKDMLDIEKELHLPIMCSKSKDNILTDNIFYIVNHNQIFKYRLNGDPERF